jgi:ATP-dependent exoDNAse (exonuclease V) alpha subunit
MEEKTLFSDSDSDDEPGVDMIHIRIIGKAGVGKSTHILENFANKENLLTAFTGIASSRLETKTLSSIFALGPDDSRKVELSLSIMYKQKAHLWIREKTGLVVDEFYTLPAGSMIKVDEILREIRNCNEPFGGMKLILVGDDRQTAAVDDAFVDSALYKSLKFKEMDLPDHPKMRLKPKYMAFCNKFRNHKLSIDKVFKYLEDPRFAKEEVPGYVVYYENRDVNSRNEEEMKKLDTPVLGTFRKLEYKKGAPIMITNNGPDVYNGMLGKLQGFDEKTKELEIEFDTYVLETHIRNVKFVPAFAITIHKCQCNTFKGVNLYISARKIKQNRVDSLRLIYTALTRVPRFSKCFIKVTR